MITTADLKMSSHDGLLRRVKQLLKKSDRFHGVLETRGETDSASTWGVPAVFSKERPVYPSVDGGVCHHPPSKEALRLGCDAGFGSLSFVTATFGFTAVSLGIDLLLSARE